MIFHNEKRLSKNALFEYWFIRMVGSTDEYDFEFARLKPFDDYDCEDDGVYIKLSDYDTYSDNFSFISSTPENKNAMCFDLFGFMFY